MTQKMRWLLTGLLVAITYAAPAQAQPFLFTPEAGLSGATQGKGSLRLFLGRARVFEVRSFGKIGHDGVFTLTQTIRFEEESSTTRSWMIRTLSPLRYAGRLTDAAGPVRGHTSGNRLSLAYRVKGPLVMHQELTLMADGKTIDNVGRVTVFGVPVGFLKETIRRVD